MLIIQIAIHSGIKWAIIQRDTSEICIDTPIHTPRMVIRAKDENMVSFKFEAMLTFVPLETGFLPTNNDRFHELLGLCFLNLGTFCVKAYHPIQHLCYQLTT